jgi:hypothetical protein
MRANTHTLKAADWVASAGCCYAAVDAVCIATLQLRSSVGAARAVHKSAGSSQPLFKKRCIEVVAMFTSNPLVSPTPIYKMPLRAHAFVFSMLLCSSAAFTISGEKGSASNHGSIGEKAPARPPNTSPPAQSPPAQSPQISSTSDATQTVDRPPSSLSRTQVIIIGSCVGAVIAAAVLVAIVIRRHRIARLHVARASPHIVIGSAQLYSPPASAPPLCEDSSASFEFTKPYAVEAHNQMPL